MSPDPNRNWRLYAEDIIEACGKAAKGIPDEVAAGAPEIPWPNVRGMRDILAHGYFGASQEIVWVTATTRMDSLEAGVRKLLAQSTGS